MWKDRILTVVLPAGLLLGSGAGAVNIRVLVAQETQLTVRVPATAAPQAPLATSGLPAPTPLPQSAWTVGVTGKGSAARLTLNGQDAGNTALYLPPSPGSVVEIGGKSYRGGVLLRLEKDQVQGINVLDLEEYLRGVVASEMPASWPASALNAQAVIARTYAAARINPAAPYDTCATQACQVYEGIVAEKARSDTAIQATRAQVIAYQGRAASTYFSSDSGGFTASSAEVWGRDIPYLTAKPDPFSVKSGSPRAKWRMDIPLWRVQEVVTQFKLPVGTLQSVKVTKTSASGRVTEITVNGSAGVGRLSGANAGGFVRALGAGSTRVNLSGLNPLTIEGYGLGHGVGLSQYGALGLANEGYDHLHILGFYYPGTSLSLLAGTEAGGARLAVSGPLPDPSAALLARTEGGPVE